jgi:CRISPR/Cas system-associated exonuclease Cas4 (RecB family)
MGAKDALILDEDQRTDLERFKEEYEKAIVGSADTSRLVETDGFHPSSLGIAAGRCNRRDFYLLSGVTKKPNFDARTYRVFANGHSVHERVQQALTNAGLLVESEVPIELDDPPVRGRADGIVELPWNKRRIILEIKSINDNGFTMRLKWKKPKDEHYDQANIYAYILGIDTIWVFYECKNDQDYVILEKKANPAAAEKQLAKWRKTYEMFKEGKKPKRPYRPDSQACTYCDLRELCFSDPEVGE